MVEDLKREVTERLLGALDPLAGVGLCEGDAEVFTHCFRLVLLVWNGRNVEVSCLGKGVEELDAFLEIGVVDAGLEAEAVLD